MNKFMYLSKRQISNDIKSLYPKCINCINFTEKTQTCKKFILSENYINYGSQNDLAVNIRSDNKKCGEAGNLFQLGEAELKKENKELLHTFYFSSMLLGVTYFITESFIVTLFPLAINLFSLCVFVDDYKSYQKKIDNEKKRIDNYNQFYKI